MNLLRTTDFFTNSSVHVEADIVERSGTAVLAILQEVADRVDEDCNRALETAREASLQLREAVDRANKLQARVEQLEDEVRKANDWLEHIRSEIEDKFLRQREPISQRS